jgi:hypothetical protein
MGCCCCGGGGEPGRGGIGRATAIEAQYDLPSNDDDTATAIATVPSLAVATGDDNSERHVTLDEKKLPDRGQLQDGGTPTKVVSKRWYGQGTHRKLKIHSSVVRARGLILKSFQSLLGVNEPNERHIILARIPEEQG